MDQKIFEIYDLFSEVLKDANHMVSPEASALECDYVNVSADVKDEVWRRLLAGLGSEPRVRSLRASEYMQEALTFDRAVAAAKAARQYELDMEYGSRRCVVVAVRAILRRIIDYYGSSAVITVTDPYSAISVRTPDGYRLLFEFFPGRVELDIVYDVPPALCQCHEDRPCTCNGECTDKDKDTVVNDNNK